MISDNNPKRGDRPIRNNFNGIIVTVLLLVAIIILIAIVIIGVKGKKMNLLHRSEAAPVSLSVLG